MRSPWVIHGLELLIVALFALIAGTFLAPTVMPAGQVQQMTMTSSTGMMDTTGMMSSTQMMTTSTSIIVAPIPGFPIESVFLGLLLGVGVLMVLRTRRR